MWLGRRFPVKGGRGHFAVVLIEFGLQEEDGRNAAGGVHDFAGLVGVQGPAEDVVLAVAEPLLDDLIAADGVLPDVERQVAPVGGAIEVDVAGLLAQKLPGRLGGHVQRQDEPHRPAGL